MAKKGAEEIKANLPFKIKDLLNFTYGFEELQKAIEYLLDQQISADGRTTKLEKDLQSRLYIVDKMKRDTDATA